MVFRADAAFAKPELYEAQEERDVKYAMRFPANDKRQRNIAELLAESPLTPQLFAGMLRKITMLPTSRRDKVRAKRSTLR